MRSRILRQLIALIALIAFSLSVAETALAAACAPADEGCETEACMEMEGEMATDASADEAEDADPDPHSMPDGADCPLMVSGACVTAAPLPVPTSDHPLAASVIDDAGGIASRIPPSRESGCLLRPPIL